MFGIFIKSKEVVMLERDKIIEISLNKATDTPAKTHRQEPESNIVANSLIENEIASYKYIQWSAYKYLLKY
jgi:hypothetical protein